MNCLYYMYTDITLALYTVKQHLALCYTYLHLVPSTGTGVQRPGRGDGTLCSGHVEQGGRAATRWGFRGLGWQQVHISD